MIGAKNQAAYLIKADTPLEVRDAPMPSAGPGEIVVKNHAIAINPLDWHMQDAGVFIQQWPAIIGCDVAGEVFEVGSNVDGFKKGDRVIGHAIGLVTGKPEHGAYALYTSIPSEKAAILPDSISFTDGVVLPFAVEAAVCALSVKVPGVALPGVATPALRLPYPTLKDPSPSLKKTLIVNGGSSSVGSATTQIASAAGIHVISLVSARNIELSIACGAAKTLDRNDPAVVEKIVQAVRESGNEFVGIFDAVAIPETYAIDLQILEKLGGGHLACSHPPPKTPENVTAGMIFAVNDVAAPVWKDYITQALECGKLKCLPAPTVVGKGLEMIQEALRRSKAGVSGTKLVVEL